MLDAVQRFCFADDVHGRDARATSWAVGVSGGADSVALLSLLRARGDLRLHVVHLDHQLRGRESAEDALFVERLARQWGLQCTVATRAQIETEIKPRPANASSFYRAMRLELFRHVVAEHKLAGVILAHHADDQAETVLHQLLRGSAAPALAGMRPRTLVSGLLIVRPLLRTPRAALREHLRRIGQPWREDSSNASDAYERNRLRRLLAQYKTLTKPLLELGDACAQWGAWLADASPSLPESFELRQARRIGSPLLEESLRRWLIDRGASANEVGSAEVARLREMIEDAAAPARKNFPGAITVRRQAGRIGIAH